MPAAQFKAQCLAVMDRVSQTGEAVVITKHGNAVAKLIPAEGGAHEIFGFMKGKGKVTGDVESTVPLNDWALD